MKVVHSWLKEYVGEALPDAQTVEKLLTFHSFEVEGIEEVEGEEVIDVDVLPNRSSDCLCHRGIARELASVLDIDLANDPLRTKPELATTNKISITIEDSAACPRFTTSLITGITVKESPDWLKKRLKAIGQRPINNIVDATNYVMFAVGEPLHAYDADLFPQVDGQWKLGVRNARPAEEVHLLAEGGKDEERVVVCEGTELLVVDGSTDAPIGLAGIKGGKFAGVHAGTKNIIVEAAHFNPTMIRKTARRLGIVIDGSKRFENEPARDLPPYAQAEIIKLITDIAGGVFEGWVDEYLEQKSNPEITIRTARVNKLLGLNLSTIDVATFLERIGCVVTQSEESCSVVGPFERTDLCIEEDLIEEVGRLYGLDKIESVIPEPQALSQYNARHFYSEKIRDTLLQLGYSEVITSSFQKKADIQLQNALASDKSYVRNSLRKNIELVLDKNFTNADLLGVKDIRVFEIGTVFLLTEDGVQEHVSLALGARQKGNGYTPKDDSLLREACASIEESLSVKIDWNIEKGIAEINMSEVQDSLPMPTTYEPISKGVAKTYVPVSVYPASSRDIALWVGDTVSPEEVATLLKTAAGDLLARLTIFDTFSKDGRTSYAFRLVFQATDRTLTEPELVGAMEAVNTAVQSKGWEVR